MYRCPSCGTFSPAPEKRHHATCGTCGEALDLSGAPQEVNVERYVEVLAHSPVPVVVDFWAHWAEPSRAAEPVVEDFARRHAGKVLVLKVNSDKAPELLQTLGIGAVPTFQALADGEEVGPHGGVLPCDAFERWADRAFHKAAA